MHVLTHGEIESRTKHTVLMNLQKHGTEPSYIGIRTCSAIGTPQSSHIGCQHPTARIYKRIQTPPLTVSLNKCGPGPASLHRNQAGSPLRQSPSARRCIGAASGEIPTEPPALTLHLTATRQSAALSNLPPSGRTDRQSPRPPAINPTPHGPRTISLPSTDRGRSHQPPSCSLPYRSHRSIMLSRAAVNTRLPLWAPQGKKQSVSLTAPLCEPDQSHHRPWQ